MINTRGKVTKALQNLDWLRSHSNQLTGSEIIRIDAIEKAVEWKVKAFDYLETKRLKYDPEYAEIRDLEVRMNKTASSLRNYELEIAQSKLKSDEDLLQTIDELKEENYWLKVELSGMRQTASIMAKAIRR